MLVEFTKKYFALSYCSRSICQHLNFISNPVFHTVKLLKYNYYLMEI